MRLRAAIEAQPGNITPPHGKKRDVRLLDISGEHVGLVHTQWTEYKNLSLVGEGELIVLC